MFDEFKSQGITTGAEGNALIEASGRRARVQPRISTPFQPAPDYPGTKNDRSASRIPSDALEHDRSEWHIRSDPPIARTPFSARRYLFSWPYDAFKSDPRKPGKLTWSLTESAARTRNYLCLCLSLSLSFCRFTRPPSHVQFLDSCISFSYAILSSICSGRLIGDHVPSEETHIPLENMTCPTWSKQHAQGVSKIGDTTGSGK